MFSKTVRRCFVVLLVCWQLVLSSQVQISTNLPHILPLKKSIVFEIQIAKTPDTWYARLEIRSDKPFGIKPGDLKGGVMEQSDTTAIVTWDASPEDTKLNISLKLMPVENPSDYNLKISYHYQKDDAQRHLNTRPFPLKFEEITLPVFLTSSMEVLRSTEQPAIPIPALEPAKVTKKSPAEVNQQAQQLKKDAKDAFLVGALEKARINKRLDTLRRDMTALGDTTGDSVKINKYNYLQKIVDKCGEEMKLAERVLTLARTLEAQAIEIERLGKGQFSGKTPPPTPKVNPVSKPTVKPPESSKQASPPVPPATIEEKGLVYKIQLGAFSNNPDLNEFRKAGQIALVFENSIYKVLQGSYLKREEAAQKKQELLEFYPDCFIVTFQDGQRVK